METSRPQTTKKYTNIYTTAEAYRTANLSHTFRGHKMFITEYLRPLSHFVTEDIFLTVYLFDSFLIPKVSVGVPHWRLGLVRCPANEN